MRFIVITLLPDPLRTTFESFRRPWNERVGAREALRYPAHITLRTGLVGPDERAEEVGASFLRHASQLHAVRGSTSGLFFAVYGEPARGMAGWRVPLTPELEHLHVGLLGFKEWQKGPQGSFQPHISLAYEDVTPLQLEELRVDLTKVAVPEAHWLIDHVALFTEMEHTWVEWARVPLQQP